MNLRTPQYAGHRENPVEKAWRSLKQQLLASGSTAISSRSSGGASHLWRLHDWRHPTTGRL